MKQGRPGGRPSRQGCRLAGGTCAVASVFERNQARQAMRSPYNESPCLTNPMNAERFSAGRCRRNRSGNEQLCGRRSRAAKDRRNSAEGSHGDRSSPFAMRGLSANRLTRRLTEKNQVNTDTQHDHDHDNLRKVFWIKWPAGGRRQKGGDAMTAMISDGGKCVAAGWTGLQGHVHSSQILIG